MTEENKQTGPDKSFYDTSDLPEEITKELRNGAFCGLRQSLGLNALHSAGLVEFGVNELIIAQYRVNGKTTSYNNAKAVLHYHNKVGNIVRTRHGIYTWPDQENENEQGI